jgi:DNA polymerase
MQDPEAVLDLMDGDFEINDADNTTMAVLSKMLRPAICAPKGKRLVWGDWSAIEGRILPWVSNSTDAQPKLELFASGEDVYVHTAASMFHVGIADVDKELRQQGKVAELALGFAGGAGALHSMGRAYGMTFTDTQAESIKEKWRRANYWAMPLWNKVEGAAMRAMRRPLVPQEVGKVSYMFTPDVLMGALWCCLPSGRLLCYPNAKIELVDGKFGPQQQITAIKGNLWPKAGESKWPRTRLWKGLLTENFVQAIAADLLRNALNVLVLDMSAPVIGHTHDEIIQECATDQVSQVTEMVKSVMESPPCWARGLPLSVECGSGIRYGK